MNLDDLRHELRSRAARPGPTSMPDRLAGVRTKVRAARRRKAAATGAAVLASVTVVGLALGPIWDGNEGEVAEGEFVPLPDRMNGDLLIDARYNEPDANELSWSVTLDDLSVVSHVTCRLPDDAVLPNDTTPVFLYWKVVGASQEYGSQCGAAAVSGLQPEGPATRSDWLALGVDRDKPFELRMWLQQGADDTLDVPGAQFGIGLYEKTGDRERHAGVALPRIVDLADESYQLREFEWLPLNTGQRSLRLTIPASDTPIAVAYGWQSELPAASCELLRDGEPFRSCYGGPIEGPEVIDSDEEQTLTVRANGSSSEGVLVLAYYELDD